MHKLFCKMKSYIQPFERTLAFKELERMAVCDSLIKENNLFQETGDSNDGLYVIETNVSSEHLIENLTYWEAIGEVSYKLRPTRQVRREATVSLVKNGIRPKSIKEKLPFGNNVPLPNRRVLRYASHGIHEYRGKFFPQLVRSLLNANDIDRDSIVLDTMCGSGTTVVEAMLHGGNAIGVDYNPLSVLMSRAKCEVLRVPPSKLVAEYDSISSDLLKRPKRNGVRPWFESLPGSSQKYLSNWFSPEVLFDLDVLIRRIHDTKDDSVRAFFLMSLSNIIRDVSWQKVDDLRVRKEVKLDIDIDPIDKFFSEMKKSFGYVLSFLYENEGRTLGEAKIFSGDARIADKVISGYLRKIDCIVTSPPYATALPYLDTDRLSIYFMSLFERSEHRKHDLDMIGNREISNGLRKKLFENYEKRKAELPASITNTIDLIHKLNAGTDAGFRRLNLPSLLSKYFFDMKKIFETYTKLLRPGAHAYVVVGNNHTVAGGQKVDIETDNYLAELGHSVGLHVEDRIPMEMLVSRDIFKKNTGSSETIICFKKSQ